MIFWINLNVNFIQENTNMKIGIVLAKPPGYSETFFYNKIEGLQKNGFEVELYCQETFEDFKLCPVYTSPSQGGNPVKVAWSLVVTYWSLLGSAVKVRKYLRLLRSEGVGGLDLFKNIFLNAHLLKAEVDWLHFGFGTMALEREIVAKAIGAKMAVSFRGFDIAIFPLKNPGCYSRLWRYIDKVHVISDDILTLVQAQGLPKEVAVKKISPAIDIKNFAPHNHKEKATGALKFLTVGRLHWKKGYVQTLQALSILNRKNIDFKYQIIGEGKEWERVAYTVHELGLSDKVELLGKLNPIQVRERLENSNLYLQYSIQEGFCNAVLEAQAMGKLCIVSDAEGLSENILHEKTGWVVPKLSPELFAAKILEVLSLSPEKKDEIRKNAVKRVNTLFTIERQNSLFKDFYQ